MIILARWAPAAALLVLLGCAEREREVELEGRREAGMERGPAESVPATRVPEETLTMWDVRFDDPAGEPGSFHMNESEGGWTIVTGAIGAAITWRQSDLLGSGRFTVGATFEQRDAPPGHAEGYGLFAAASTWTIPTSATRTSGCAARGTT